jgi:hypothetical protein
MEGSVSDLKLSILWGLLEISSTGELPTLLLLGLLAVLVGLAIRLATPPSLASVLFSFYPFLAMWKTPTERKDFVFMVRMGLRKGLSLIRGMKKSLTEDQQQHIAETIVHEIETTNWKIEQGPPARPPG